MSNSLLNCGWVEYWEPNIALGSLKGMINGIDFAADPHLSVVDFLAFPSGKAVQAEDYFQPDVSTPINALLGGFGATDFLGMLWFQSNSIDGGPYVYYTVGEAHADGFQFGLNSGAIPKAPFGNLPCSDLSYPQVDGVANSFSGAGIPHCLLFWWTAVDKTLHIQMDGGAEHTLVSPVGAGTPDLLTPVVEFVLRSDGDTSPDVGMFASDMGICKAPIPDATQRSLLFGGLPFSQWDSGAAVIPQRAASGQYAIRTH